MAEVQSTNINAFRAELDLAEAELVKATAKRDEAKQALEAQEGLQEPKETKPRTRRSSRSAVDGKFVFKKQAKKSPKTTVTETRKGK